MDSDMGGAPVPRKEADSNFPNATDREKQIGGFRGLT
jgi:hypothetical protein